MNDLEELRQIFLQKVADHARKNIDGLTADDVTAYRKYISDKTIAERFPSMAPPERGNLVHKLIRRTSDYIGRIYKHEPG